MGEKPKQISKQGSTILQSAFLMQVISRNLISLNFCHVLRQNIIMDRLDYQYYLFYYFHQTCHKLPAGLQAD
jgi:hypothetical protein